MNQNKMLSLGGLIFVATSFIGLMYRKVLVHPNAFLFGNTNDSIKNYYTFTAQSASDTWVTDSSGMILQVGFDQSPTDFRVAGNGAYQGHENDRKRLWTIRAGLLNLDTSYVLCFRFSNFGKNFGQNITKCVRPNL